MTFNVIDFEKSLLETEDIKVNSEHIEEEDVRKDNTWCNFHFDQDTHILFDFA